MAEFTLTLTPEPGGWRWQVTSLGRSPSSGMGQTKELARAAALDVIRQVQLLAGPSETFTVTADASGITSCAPVKP